MLFLELNGTIARPRRSRNVLLQWLAHLSPWLSRWR